MMGVDTRHYTCHPQVVAICTLLICPVTSPPSIIHTSPATLIFVNVCKLMRMIPRNVDTEREKISIDTDPSYAPGNCMLIK